MKKIEERVADAISELEDLLMSGQLPEDAIPIAAKTEDLRPEVLRLRAEKALGDLQAVKAKNDLQAKRIAEQRKAKSSIYEFAEMDKVNADFPNWFEQKTGRLPTQAEIEEMERLSWEALLRKISFEI